MTHKFELVDTLARFGELEAAWVDLEARTLPTAAFAGFDWIALSWRHAPDTVVATVWEDDRLVLGLALSRRPGKGGRWRYRMPRGPMIQLASILIDRETDSAAAITSLLTGLRTEGRGDSLKLLGIPADSPLGRWTPMTDEAVSGEPAQIDLPEGFEPYFASLSRNARWQHRRRLRNYRGVRVATAASWPDDLDWFLRTKQVWTPPSGEPLRDWLTSPAGADLLAGLGAKRADNGGALLLMLETPDGVRAAGKLMISLGDRAIFYATTYDPAFAHDSPGNVLLVEALRIVAARGIVQLDLMPFHADYKDRFKTSTEVQRRIRIDLAAYSPAGSPWSTVPDAATGVMGVGTGRTGATPSTSLRPAMIRKRSASLAALWRRMLRSMMKLE